MDFPIRYNSKESELRIIKYWIDNSIFKFNKQSNKPIYSVDTPPPTVSGKMHLGHAFSYSQQDIIVRYKRMAGFNVFYPFGTDDNGLPTLRLIEKSKNVSAIKLGREKFRKLCLETLEKELRPRYIKDWKRIGISCDWELFYTTIDNHCRRWSQKSFIELYKKGREYRKEAPVIYCPNCKTAIAQVECLDKEVESYFNDIVFKIGDRDLIIATTRPELLPSCVAVFYHPDDKRYKHLKNKKAKVPLFNFEVPILEDSRVDVDKGTGIVMCCTFGDMTDMEWQKAYNLPIRMSIGKDGRMTDICGRYAGLKIKEARKKIIEDLKETGLLKKQKKIKHTVNVHERCGTEIEFIHSKQWFIKYLDLKKDMLKWGNELNWYPKHMKNRYDNWVKGLQWDWCISRQIYFGIPFPVWYCSKCEEIILAKEEDLPVDPIVDKPPLERCPKCGCDKIIPEKDVINTWATSALTPQIAASLIPKMFDKLFPMSLRPQAHDIISFWLFNTVVKSQLHYNKNPWRDCVISGWALDPKGKKMSKSRGNVIEPIKMIEKYSADALRFWAAGSKLGEDLAFQEKHMITGQKTITKIWNASRFVIMNLYKEEKDLIQKNYKEIEEKLKQKAVGKNLNHLNLWLLTRLSKVVDKVSKSFDVYEYSKAKSLIEIFFWRDFCDNYLEIIKDRFWNEDNYKSTLIDETRNTLYYSLLTILKLFAPIMPFVTEKIYQLYFKYKEKEKSIHISNWPVYIPEFIDEKNELTFNVGMYIIASLRRFKSVKKVSLKTPIDTIFLVNQKAKEMINRIKEDLKTVMHIDNMIVVDEKEFTEKKLEELPSYEEQEIENDKLLLENELILRVFVKLKEWRSEQKQ